MLHSGLADPVRRSDRPSRRIPSLDWHAVATVATWFMTLIMQRAEHRDTLAIHAKLDELLSAEGHARAEVTSLDDEEPEVIEAHRAQERDQ